MPPGVSRQGPEGGEKTDIMNNNMQETTRQQKIARQIQKDVADIFSHEFAPRLRGVMATVTAVRVSPDFGYAKVYVSVFPFGEAERIMQLLDAENWFVRRALGQRIKHQLKVVPELQFFLDDSLEYIENIERAMNASDRPVAEPAPAREDEADK